EVELRARFLGELLEVGLVFMRYDHALYSGTLCRECLLADAADRQHLASQSDLAGHRDVVCDRDAADEGDDCGGHRDSRRRPVLGDRPRGDMQVDVVVGEPRRVEAELDRVGANPRMRGGGGFLHDLAELAGDGEPPFPGIGRRFDEENVAAHRGDGEPRCDARLGGPFSYLAREAPRPEPLASTLLADPDLRLPALRNLACRPPAEIGDPPLEVAYARLARVLAGDDLQRVVADRHLSCFEAVRLELLRNQVLAGDREL